MAYAVLKAPGKKKGERGITSKHRDLDAARAAVEKMATEATGKLGWKRRERKAGFVARPDAFTSLPSATATPGAYDHDAREEQPQEVGRNRRAYGASVSG